MIRLARMVVLVGVSLLTSGGFAANVAEAQSKVSAYPGAMSPGVNKGNVVNFDGPQFWYFWGGPGRFEVRTAFHEMGLLGNPYKQNLVVDLIDKDGKSIWHGVITSQGNTAEIKAQMQFPDRRNVRVRVLSPNGLIRMGGYYEIEATGAASFDGKAGATAGVKADMTDSLVHSSGPLVHSSGPLVKSSGGPLVQSSGPLVKSGGPLVYPGKALIVHETAQELRILLAADVLFDFGKADIRPDAEVTLRQAATKMKFAKERGPILIEGFTDSKGTAGLNQRLSKERADAVETWLVKNAGYAVSRLTAKGYGAARPVAENAKPDGSDDPAGRQFNRRVEIVMTK